MAKSTLTIRLKPGAKYVLLIARAMQVHKFRRTWEWFVKKSIVMERERDEHTTN